MLKNTEFILRDMTLCDVYQVYAIEKKVFSNPWTKSMFEEEMKRQSQLSYFLVAVLGPRIVGYMGFWLILEESHIINLAVDPDFRKQGIGEKLLIATNQKALDLGAKCATLEVRMSNQSAIELYLKHGFEIVAIRPKYYQDNQEDAFIMWKNPLPKV